MVGMEEEAVTVTRGTNQEDFGADAGWTGSFVDCSMAGVVDGWVSKEARRDVDGSSLLERGPW